MLLMTSVIHSRRNLYSQDTLPLLNKLNSVNMNVPSTVSKWLQVQDLLYLDYFFFCFSICFSEVLVLVNVTLSVFVACLRPGECPMLFATSCVLFLFF